VYGGVFTLERFGSFDCSWYVHSLSRFIRTIITGADAWNLIVLAGFVVASLEEDAYGVLQKDIPKILEALTSYLIMLENYTRELQASVGPGDVEKKVQVEEGLTRVVEPLVGGGFERFLWMKKLKKDLSQS